MSSISSLPRIQIKGTIKQEYKNILTENACSFLIFLHSAFEPERRKLMDSRELLLQKINSGWRPTFPTETEYIRNDPIWVGASPAPGLIDRRVEITGPVDCKMIINALNSGATQFMADFEGQLKRCYVQKNISDHPKRKDIQAEGQSRHSSCSVNIVFYCRPRGWHLVEKHVLIDDQPISASIFDFGLFFFHNAQTLIQSGVGPYFYLPKIEHYLEARLWNSIFNASQDYLAIPRGTIRATVLIETILASFQMEEIIYELRSHSSGLNCGRWDYIFSFIKKFGAFKEFLLPDRSQVTMSTPFMSAYTNHLIYVCHKRQVHAMGGMAAQIPIKSNAELNDKALNKVRDDKLREVLAGHDGTWVAHPDLIQIAKEIFDSNMQGPNQLHVKPSLSIRPGQLLDVSIPGSEVTLSGVKDNIAVCLLYMESWLNGSGCIPINHLMEDAATAEIARTQLWQWLRHSVSVKLSSNSCARLTKDLLMQYLKDVSSELKLTSSTGVLAQTRLAQLLFSTDAESKCPEFLTSACYDDIVRYVPSATLNASKL
ncbi:malate synthase [Mitosporidium daphniae]|uniref:malate synthase n=1 Tax=Mitosporidium daphniae TaxID=1485682 RepID=A0A098VNV7_9MICR|nr:malate synthase [Mitosporidium daphniae]KGG50655.1 malate synthase [Mitosporidium daphniae]|eukprot:XP_013237139.1 malate synthase [Mitosporidium daphniae]